MLYYVHNTSRAVTKRLQRYTSATHRGLVQFIAGQRIVRGRPIILTEEGFRKNEAIIRKGIADGYLELRTADGRLINPDTHEVLPPAPVARVTPIEVLDSAKNDKPSGNPMPIYPMGVVQSPVTPTMEQEQEYVEPRAGHDSTPHATMEVAEDDEVEIEHTEAGSGIKKGGKRGRR